MKTSLVRSSRTSAHHTGPLPLSTATCLLLIVISLLIFQQAQATTYLLEPFDYAAPTPLTNAPPWSTNGTPVEANPTQLIVPGDFAYPPLTQPTTVNSACLQWSSNVKGERAIPGGPYGDPINGGTVYCSFMLYKATTNFSVANLPIVGLCTDNSTTLNSATCNGIVLNIKSAAGGAYQLGIKLGGGVTSAVYPPSGQTYNSGDTNLAIFGQTNFIVMKYTYVPGGANDTVALWVNPDSSSFGLSEPAATANDVGATNASGFNADAAGLAFVQIRGGTGASAGVLQMDNLRIGSAWADVTPTCVTATINSPPANQAVAPGQTATFTIGVPGANPAFQWQTNKNNAGWIAIPGATNTSYTTVPEVLGDNGLQFRCVVNVACDNSSITSSPATLTVENCVAAATSNPTNQTVTAGSTATFTIVPTGSHPTMQWQTNNNNAGWLSIPTATNASYTTAPEGIADDGLQFRCIVSEACNSSSATSSAATLSVVCHPAQVSSLGNITVVAGQSATFTVTSGSSTPRYQWATNNGGGWLDIPGATNASYTTAPETVNDYGLQFQCTVSNVCDSTTASTSATLLVNCFTAAVATDIANTSVALGAGQTATFSFTANGSLPTYQWKTNNGAGWVDISGATSANYTTPPLLLANNGLHYQCIATVACDGSTASSAIATISVYSDNAEFLSVGSGNLGDRNSWEQSFDGGGTFSNPALYSPADVNSTNTVIQNGHTVTSAANVPLNHVAIQSGGQLSVNTGTTVTLTTNGVAGTALDVSGTMDVSGALTINSNAQAMVESGGLWKTEQGGTYTVNGVLTFKSGAVYQHNTTTTAGTIPTATWNTGSSCQVVGITTSIATLAGVAQTFYNFIWNCPNQSSALPWGGSVPTNNGDFTFISTGTGETRISNNNSPAMNILGNFNLQGGQLTLASGTGKPALNLSGNAVLSGGVLSNSLGSAGATMNFVKAGTQSFANSGTTIIGPINWVIKSNSTVQCSGILSSNLILSAGGQIRLTTNLPLFQVIGNITNNNATVVVDLGGATLGNGTYPLMTYQGSLTGFFQSTPVIINGGVTGAAFISTTTAHQVNLVVATPHTPNIASFGVAGTSLNLTATNGIAGDSYGVLATTNVALPLNQWTPVLAHGVFDGSGNLSTSIQLTNTPGTNSPQLFFKIQMPSP